VDLINGTIYPGTVEIAKGKITAIKRGQTPYGVFILPGFIDSHVHIESSMIIPSEFARLATTHGTVATVSDPHEIANVLGIDGVMFMINNGSTVPFKFYFGAPSCVPATTFETNGATLDTDKIERLLEMKEILYLSEVMNVPGVLYRDPAIMGKIRIARRLGKKVDGHAPGLRGEHAKQYCEAGISTDHECLDIEEALEKIGYGMKIHIREASAARCLNILYPLLENHSESCMFCSDDIHPDDLIQGHINEMVRKTVQYGIDRMKVLRCATVNPVMHYGLDVGLLRPGDPADFIVVNNLDEFCVMKTVINGAIVAECGETLIPSVKTDVPNNFRTEKKSVSDFKLKTKGPFINVIEAVEGELVTYRRILRPKVKRGYAVSDIANDVLKIAVVNRYQDAPPSIGFVKGFGIKKGALASSIAHDSHNIIAIGTTDEELCAAVNCIIEQKGGLCCINEGVQKILPLPVAGIMTDKDGKGVAQMDFELHVFLKNLCPSLSRPFMTLSFMALLVIPELKISDRGLFDGKQFTPIDLFSR